MQKRLRNFDDVHAVLGTFVMPVRSERSPYTLERIQVLMEKLGKPQNQVRVIHVAGTSGKTSTCYYLAAFLAAAGKKVGLTVSPHVDEVNERVQINLQPLSEKQFCQELEAFLRVVDKTGIKPTYFELLVAFAYWEFAKQKVDYAVIEVGLGGLLDGTNVINRADKVCIITDIGLDHMDVLGHTTEEIAAQKAGIVLPHNSVFAFQQAEGIMAVFREVCEQQSAELHEIIMPPSTTLPHNLPLFQRRNWYLAATVYNYLIDRDKLPELSNEQVLKTTHTLIPARMELVNMPGGKTLVMDAAHNAQKMHLLAKSMRNRFKDQPIATLFSLVQSKNFRLRTTLEEIIKLSNHLIITTFNSQQDFRKVSVNPRKVAQYCQELGFTKVTIVSNPQEAYRALLARPESILLITGSFYLMNHIRPLIFGQTSVEYAQPSLDL